MRITEDKILSYCSKLFDEDTAQVISERAFEIIKNTSPVFISGRREALLICGLLYLLSRKYGFKKTQRKICWDLGDIFTDVALRNNYKKWKEYLKVSK